MFVRFTDRAGDVMALAEQEARRLNHGSMGTEHLLLGLVGNGGGVAAMFLRNMGLDPATLRREVEKLVAPGPIALSTATKLPMAPRLKRSMEQAIEESRRLDHRHVGTEHL